MNKIKKYLFSTILFLTCFLAIPNIKAASVSVYSRSNNVIVGNNVTVTVTVSADAEAWDFSVGYDTSKLRVVSSNLEAGMRSASASSLHSRSYSITFKAIASGNASVYINDAALYDNNSSSLGVSKGSKTFTLRTQAEIEASYSKNNYLAALSVDGVELSPTFNRDVMEYSVELEPETASLNVNASVADSTASVIGVGAHALVEGSNRIEVIVTAQNGTTRTYVINANVKEFNPIEVDVDGKKLKVVRKKADLTPPTNYTETSVVINEEEVPAFKSDITKYTLVSLKDDKGNQNFYVYEKGKYTLYKEYKFNGITLYPMELDKEDIPNNYKKTTITYNDEKIVAYKIKASSKYALIYGMNVETGEENIYMYDSKEDTLQIYNTEEITKLTEDNILYLKVMLGLGILSIVLIITIIVILVKNKKKSKKVNSKEIKNIKSEIDLKK